MSPRPAAPRLLVGLILLALLAACSSPAPAVPTQIPATNTPLIPTDTPVPPTPTASPTPAPTNTPVPPTDTPTATATLPAVAKETLEDGWVRYTVTEQGYSIDVPAEWTRIDMTAGTLDLIHSSLESTNPEMAKSIQGQAAALAQAGIKLYILDATDEGLSKGFPPNLNVIRQAETMGLSLNAIVTASKNQLEAQSYVVKPVQVEDAILAAGDGKRLQYQMKTNLPTGQSVNVTIVQYVFMDDAGVMYITTLGYLTSQAKTYAEVMQKVGESFNLVK